MPGRILVFAAVIILLIFFMVYMVELFIPLQARFNMNSVCRGILIKMEQQGGMTPELKAKLEERLGSLGFSINHIHGTIHAGQGEEIQLCVEADYTYGSVTRLFARENITSSMKYKKYSTGRKVMN